MTPARYTGLNSHVVHSATCAAGTCSASGASRRTRDDALLALWARCSRDAPHLGSHAGALEGGAVGAPAGVVAQQPPQLQVFPGRLQSGMPVVQVSQSARPSTAQHSRDDCNPCCNQAGTGNAFHAARSQPDTPPVRMTSKPRPQQKPYPHHRAAAPAHAQTKCTI